MLRFSLTSLTSYGTGTCRRYLCNPCVPHFQVLLETQEDAEMSISSKGVQSCCLLQKLHFKHLLRSVNILKSFRLEIIALHKCLIDTEAALKALINAYIPLEYIKISDCHLEKQTWAFLALIRKSRKTSYYHKKPLTTCIHETKPVTVHLSDCWFSSTSNNVAPSFLACYGSEVFSASSFLVIWFFSEPHLQRPCYLGRVVTVCIPHICSQSSLLLDKDQIV